MANASLPVGGDQEELSLVLKKFESTASKVVEKITLCIMKNRFKVFEVSFKFCL